MSCVTRKSASVCAIRCITFRLEMELCTLSDIFEWLQKNQRKKSSVQSIIKNSKDVNEVKQAEFIMFSWEEFKIHPDEVREMYEIISKAQELLDIVKRVRQGEKT